MENDGLPAVPVRLTRRGFFGAAGAFAAASVVATAGCSDDTTQPMSAVDNDIDNSDFGYVPPSQAPARGVLRFFTAKEMETLTALVARIVPGDASDPGAVEAGVPTYIDAMLAEFETFDEPTYQSAPFVGDEQPEQPLPVGVDLLSDADLKRYGFQSDVVPQDAYRLGLAQLDAFAKDTIGSDFAAASTDDQDLVLRMVTSGQVTGFERPTAEAFFRRVRRDTIHGMFCDPLYGGNRDKIGWRFIGYPGAQRAWTAEELSNGPNPTRVPQGLADLHHSHPGQPGGTNVIHPVEQPNPKVHS